MYSRVKAFTLIEIMVVIIIIGIMAAFAVPNMAKVKEKAIFSEGVQALQILHAAQLRYNLKEVAGGYASACSQLDTTLRITSNFEGLGCGEDGSVLIARKDYPYAIGVDVSGKFSCIAGCDTPVYDYLLSLCPNNCNFSWPSPTYIITDPVVGVGATTCTVDELGHHTCS